MYISTLLPLALLAVAGVVATATPEPNTVWYDLSARDVASDGGAGNNSSSSSSSSSVAATSPSGTSSSSSATSSTTSSSSPKASNKTTQKPKHFECGTNITHASKEFLAKSHELHNKKLQSKIKGGTYNYARKVTQFLAGRQATPAPVQSVTVDTYFHIVQSQDGTITPDMATAQIQALNSAYNPYNIHFLLRNTSFTTDPVWATGASGTDDQAMKTALRQGTYSSLNIYFQTDLAGGVLGKCTLPAQIYGYVPPSAYVSDGCNVNAQTMPGGWFDEYNLGQTAVHETGHWLGLLHVFENYSCDPANTGDLIADTPQQSVSTDGCPTSPVQDSCPGDPGVDSIHNVMDYSYDSCYEGFTNDQIERVLTLWPQFRQGY